MAPIAPDTVRLEPLGPVIGAEVLDVDLTRPLAASTLAELRAALLTWKVLFFRDQDLTREQHVAFAEHWGTATSAHPVIDGAPEDANIHRLDTGRQQRADNEAMSSPLIPARDPEALWHTDLTFVANPATASVLRAISVPPQGGDTLWSNLVVAYEALSRPIRDLIDSLRAVHVWHDYPGTSAAIGDRSASAAVHPVVRVHPETRERAIFVSPMHTSHILGLTARESIEILDLLYDQIRRPEFTVRFRWQPHSVVIWDNRSTAHLGPADGEHVALDRVMERVTIAGDLPYGPDGSTSEALTGDLFR